MIYLLAVFSTLALLILTYCGNDGKVTGNQSVCAIAADHKLSSTESTWESFDEVERLTDWTNNDVLGTLCYFYYIWHAIAERIIFFPDVARDGGQCPNCRQKWLIVTNICFSLLVNLLRY